MLYRKNKLGEELELPIFNHYYNISITALEFYLKNPGQSDTYIITFKQDNNLFIVDMTHDLGHTSHFDAASLSGIAAVPLAACLQHPDLCFSKGITLSGTQSVS